MTEVFGYMARISFGNGPFGPKPEEHFSQRMPVEQVRKVGERWIWITLLSGSRHYDWKVEELADCCVR